VEKVVINVIGTGYDICIDRLDGNLNFEFDLKETSELHNCLFGIEFYKKQHVVNNHKVIHSWKDFNTNGMFRGADVLEYGQIEIWINRRRRKTYKFHELKSDLRLFPLFEITEEYINSTSQLIIGVQEKGFLAKFVFQSEEFSIEEIKLHFVNIPLKNRSIPLLYKISYCNTELKSQRSDTIITSTVLNMVGDKLNQVSK